MDYPPWMKQYSHRRLNPLTGEWVLVSPQRATRPWFGQLENLVVHKRKEYESSCFLCPGNTRANGIKNPLYKHTYVFENNTPSLLHLSTYDQLSSPLENSHVEDIISARPEEGICRVVCYSPKHNVTMAHMSETEIVTLIQTWKDQCKELASKPFINHIQIFENKGNIMGCSQPHPHGQIWAQQSIPTEPLLEQNNQLHHFQKTKASLLEEYVLWEIEQGDRIVYKNTDFVVVVPFWAVWPYETMIIPTFPLSSIEKLNEKKMKHFALALSTITSIYDKIFDVEFPYSMGIHQQPCDQKEHPEWQLHVHFYPPLLRSKDIKKFMVGYELLAEQGRDITPEQVAEQLRGLM